MGQAECKAFNLGAADPAQDTVKVNANLLDQSQDPAGKVGSSDSLAEQTVDGIDPHADEDGASRERAREDERREQDERERKEEAERAERDAREREEIKLLEEREEAQRKADLELAAAAEAARVKAEADEKAKKEEEAAKSSVSAWLKDKGFKDVNIARKKMFKSEFALHQAVRDNDAKMVAALIVCGADATKKSSAGQTPRELAAQLNTSKGSDAFRGVLSALP